jgi:uncharacterized RDD family membrane protein YckC
VRFVSVGSGIVTPEAVVLDLERAGVASRLLAIVLDVLMLGTVYFLLFLLAVTVFGSAEGVIGAVLAVVGSLGAYLAWFCVFEALMGRTPGKAALGLRVIATDGTPARFPQTFLRAVLGIIDFIAVPFGLIAIVATLLSPRDQRLGDVAAGTLVVRQRAASNFVAPAHFPPPPGYEAYVGALDVGAMTVAHYGLIRTFLLRAHHLAPLARVQMAVRLANPLATNVLRHQPPHYLHPETFLVCVAAAWQRTHAYSRL